MTRNMNDDIALEKTFRDASKAFTPPDGLKEGMRASLLVREAKVDSHNVRDAGIQMATRSRMWLWRCAAAAAALAVLAVGLLVVWSNAHRSAFAQALDHAFASLGSVQSYHAIHKVVNGAQEFSYESWRKRPDKERAVGPDGRVTISDGARRVTFDPSSLEALQEIPAPSAGTLFPQILSVDGWLSLARSYDSTPQGPLDDTVDGQTCSRFDLTVGKGIQAERRTRMWFHKTNGLLLRCEVSEVMPDFKMVEYRQTTTYDYNVPVDDALFAIPAGLKPVGSPPPEPQLIVSVTGPDGKPVAGATVYHGHNNWFVFDRLSTGFDGQATVPLKWPTLSNHPWIKVVEGTETDWLGNFNLGLVVAESADSNSCDFFDMEWLDVFARHGFQVVNRDAKRVTFQPGRKEFTFGPANQLRYDPAESKVYLSLQLKTKGAVTGRIVSANGSPFSTGKVRMWPVCMLREGYYTGFGKARNTLEKAPARGTIMSLLDDRVFWFCAEDGTFSVDVPAGYRFKLVIQTINVKDTIVLCNWPGMTKFARQGKGGSVAPATALAPGEVRDIGEIRLPAKVPPD